MRNPELVILEGDYFTPEEINIIQSDPELMGQWATVATVGTGIAKGVGKVFKKLGIGKRIRAKRRARVDKWKKKILAERARKQAALIQKQRIQSLIARGQASMDPKNRSIAVRPAKAGIDQNQMLMIGLGSAAALMLLMAMKNR